MKIYLAGRPEEHLRFNNYARDLRDAGFDVVSTWHTSPDLKDTLEQLRRVQDAQGRFLAKFMRIVCGNSTEPEEVTNEDRIAVGSGPSAFALEERFAQFTLELNLADTVVAELNGGAMEAGYARARGLRLVAIGAWESALIPFGIDDIKLARDWKHAFALLDNLRAAMIF